ncbi:DUF488 family protein [Pseudomonas sp. MAFF212428]|uniref:DUF488 family protein n=1 Tax=Pseudomonas brassicae TaxID=2708063 RepID=A0A6B3NQI8_9PSED|nr:DUF488 family protein [Pseudomonas brassicae]NER59337.1 DUF488 family protein [Pseudomonas brassicae]NER63341.1 DUF488 family protein [Pseudomonas brassicae]
MIRCKRAYEPAAPEDGQRVLVDRLWPRNRRKDQLALLAWLPQVAPSAQLRQAFHAHAMAFDEFAQHYRAQLAAQPQHWWGLLDKARSGTLTLVYAARDERHNNAQVLAGWLEDELERHGPGSSPVCYADLPGPTV